MKLSRKTIIILALCGMVIFFLFREWRIQQAPVLQILGEKNALLIVHRQNLFGFGDIDSIQPSVRSMTSYFSRQKVENIFDLEVGQEMKGENFSIQKLSPNVVRGEWEGKSFFFFADDFTDSERGEIVSSGVSLESDYWVMRQNRLNDFLPKPKEGILFVGERTPSEKTRDWCTEYDIPLVTEGETGGFLVKYNDTISSVFSRKD